MSDEQNTKPEAATDPQGRLDALVTHRDHLIRQLWLVYRDMSNELQPDDFPQADLNLWGLVTSHDAVQSRL